MERLPRRLPRSDGLPRQQASQVTTVGAFPCAQHIPQGRGSGITDQRMKFHE